MSRPRAGTPAAGCPVTRAGEGTATRWRKSSRSGPTGGNCVETASLPSGAVAVRDSRYPAGPALVFTAAEWAAFTGGLKLFRRP